MSALQAQQEVDPFSVFGDAPPELVLHEVYDQQHYSAVGPAIRASHPILAKLDRQRLLLPPAPGNGGCGSKSGGNSLPTVQAQQHAASGVPDKLHLTREMWEEVLLPALQSWWCAESAVELDWRQDPLTAEDCAWYLQAIGASRDLTDQVTLKQPCFCPTPPPLRGWSWTDSRHLLRTKLASGTLTKAAGESGCSWPSFSPPKRRTEREKHTRVFAKQRETGAPAKRRGAAAFAGAAVTVLSPITPGVRHRRQRKYAEMCAPPEGAPASSSSKRSRKEAPRHRCPSDGSTRMTANSSRSAAGAEGGSFTRGVTSSSSLTGELGELLADAQRRLDSLAERMRSRSRSRSRLPPKASNGTDAAVGAASRLVNRLSGNSLAGRAGGRSLSGDAAVDPRPQGHGIGGEAQRAPTDGSSRQLKEGNALRLAKAPIRAGQQVEADGLGISGRSYYSSSNLPLLGREMRSLLVPPPSGGVTSATREAIALTRAPLGIGKLRVAAEGGPRGPATLRERQKQGRFSVEKLRALGEVRQLKNMASWASGGWITASRIGGADRTRFQ
ncbi:inner centromere ark-binding region protein [Cyclospora cayetanensis]|uniref:Inner centromere ark-binding region protein n=1 Tax=Cyclospora cayetanensis TaxID=88456 RepID=A0A1D3CS29_9EIME|nr:inner centromere ark-binding region protein [Cyclospora cayetanensis]